MRKRMVSFLMTAVLIMGLLPIPAGAVSQTEEAKIKSAVAKVITDYAKKVYRPNADDEAFDLFFKHGFFGNGADMKLNESSPMVSALFNSGLMQEGLAQGLSDAIVRMQEYGLDTVNLYSNISWHEYFYDYTFHLIAGTEADFKNYIGHPTWTEYNYQGKKNENDTVMELLVGGLNVPVVIKKSAVSSDCITYEARITICDDFDFTSDYSKISDKGYNTSTDSALVNLGWLLTFVGLDAFYWEYDLTFVIEVPNFCEHSFGNYRWVFEPSSVTVNSVVDGDFIENNTVKNVYETTSSTTGAKRIRYYHKLDDSVFLLHNLPWVLEYDQTGLQELQFGPSASNAGCLPKFYALRQNYVWWNYSEKIERPGMESNSSWSEKYNTVNYYIGVETTDKFLYKRDRTYTYTFENVIIDNGTNMIYLTVYDHSLEKNVFGPEPMDDCWIQQTGEEERTKVSDASNLLVGKDLSINYLGSKNISLGPAEMTLDLRIYPYGKDGTAPDDSNYRAPTCTERGGAFYTCLQCGCEQFIDVEPALGHSFGAYVYDNNATCTENGTQTRKCTVCGVTETVTAPETAKGHSYESAVTEPSYEAQGYTTYTCTICGDSYKGDYTDLKQHSYIAVITEPTCTAQGFTTYTCSKCGDSYVDDYTDVVDHTPVIDPAVPPTCVEKGKTEGSHCSVCGEILKKQALISTTDRHNMEETLVKMPTNDEPGQVAYICKDCGKTDYMEIPPLNKPERTNPFTDVLESDWFYEPVLWAVENGVTGGKTETTFAPYEGCTRAQVVTFLWAANGKPEPTTENPFTDVAEDAWYLKPVLWAVENGITTGVTATEFGPEQTCTRAQIATFLWAANGKPVVSSKSEFVDVANGDWFATPIIWAKENDVTGGIGEGKFGPNDTCTRAQVVTFLKKVYANK